MHLSKLVPVAVALFSASASATQAESRYIRSFFVSLTDSCNQCTTRINGIYPDGPPTMLEEKSPAYSIIIDVLHKLGKSYVDLATSTDRLDATGRAAGEHELTSEEGVELITSASADNGPILACEACYSAINNVYARLPAPGFFDEFPLVGGGSEDEQFEEVIANMLRDHSNLASWSNHGMFYEYFGTWLQENQREALDSARRWCEWDIRNAWATWTRTEAPPEPAARGEEPEQIPTKKNKRCFGLACQA